MALRGDVQLIDVEPGRGAPGHGDGAVRGGSGASNGGVHVVSDWDNQDDD